jgi:thiol-disulfide isomerase/thioredoxin
MVKQFMYVILFMALASCRGYRTAEGRVKPVYFTADSQIFTDTIYPPRPVTYPILQGLQGNSIQELELREGDTTKGFIKKPTFFWEGFNIALIYPNERVQISGEGKDGNYSFSIVNGSSRRNRELAFFQTFLSLDKWPHAYGSLREASVQDILEIEKEQKEAIAKTESGLQVIFDSLLTVYNVSKKFKKLTQEYVHNKYYISLLGVYMTSKDTLVAHGLYTNKLRQLVPAINAITEEAKFNDNVQSYLNELIRELFPHNLMWSFDEEGFRACFDSVENNFTNRARDYLLSRLMYRAYAKGLKVPAAYVGKYRDYSINKAYQKIVLNTKKERERNDADTKGSKTMLLSADGKSKFRLEKVLAQHKGKLILIDMWASWCGPCLKEMPYLNQLRERYSEDKIIFLPISLEAV